MVAATLVFSGVNAIAKHLAETYGVAEVLWARFTLATLLLALVYQGRLVVLARTRRLGLQLARSGYMVASTVLFFLALHWMPLADASALLFTAPIIVALLSAPMLAEPVGRGGWIAIACGFAGAMAFTRPGGGGDATAWAVAFGSAVLFALYQITTRSLSHTDTAVTTLVYTSVAGTVLTSAVMPFAWTTPSPIDWALMAALGALGTVGQFAMIKAFELAPAATVSPLTYVGLVWAAAWGLLWFGDVPDAWTLSGATLIAASGVHLFRRRAGFPARRPDSG